jgi:uncharacterized protein YidB (DUF937 family)
MSLLDTLASSFGNSSSQGGGAQSGLIAAAMEFVNNQPGGLNGLIQRFHENGAGDIVSSWVGNGENKPISSDTVTNVLGSDAVSQIAQKAGLSGEPRDAGRPGARGRQAGRRQLARFARRPRCSGGHVR